MAKLQVVGGHSHIFKLQLYSCSRIFESGSKILSNLGTQLLFWNSCNHWCNWNSSMFVL